VLNSVISKSALLTGDMHTGAVVPIRLQFPVFKLLYSYSGILGFIERNLISGMHLGLFLAIIIYIIYLDLNLVAMVFQIDASLTPQTKLELTDKSNRITGIGAIA